jgi:hypothetical protein
MSREIFRAHVGFRLHDPADASSGPVFVHEVHADEFARDQ